MFTSESRERGYNHVYRAAGLAIFREGAHVGYRQREGEEYVVKRGIAATLYCYVVSRKFI